MIDRCTNSRARKDAVLAMEGSEGEGKTNASIAVAYYVKSKTKRNINMFFRLHNLIEFAKNTKEQIIIWDEPAIDSLSTDHYKSINKDLQRLYMTCRKKRHFFINNFVKFWKFSEYVVVDRSLGLVHLYSRGGIIPGRFIYVRQKKMEFLYNDYKFKKQRNYKKYSSFGGNFVLLEDKMKHMGITIEGKENCSLEDYEEIKDKAIASIGSTKKKVSADYRKLQELKKSIGDLKFPILTQEQFCNKFNISIKTFHNWRNIAEIGG